MKENIKIGLLAVIAGLIGYIAFIKPDPEIRVKNKDMNPAPALEQNTASQTDPHGHNDMPQPVADPTYISFTKTSHDFGKTTHGKENKVIFKFTNTGDKPLIITEAKGSCSCTVPETPKEPIAPGASGEIPVIFTAKEQQNGVIEQTVTVTANTTPPQTQLKIKAFVE